MNTEPSWSPDGESIVFISKRDGNNEVYIMNKDGSSQKRLTDTPQSESQPSWSPDGTRILFHSERTGVRQIFSMNRDGSDQRNLTNSDVIENHAVWSPSGQKIAFTSIRDENAQVYLMDPDGSNPLRIIESTTNISLPEWSPDGKKIVCMSLDLNGHKMDYIKFDLQENSAEPLFPKVKQAYRFLTWSTNSSAILYAISQSYSATERISTVYLSDVKLNDSKPIVRNVRQLINAKMSPRGDALLYEAAEQVYVVLLDDKKTIRIGKSHHSPEWSLDGAHIVMVSKQKMNIFTVRPDGTELKQLTFIK